VLLAENVPHAYQHTVGFLGHPTSAPPDELFAQPIWTTWAQYKMAINQADVLSFADTIVGRQYPHSVMEIDDRWQTSYGTCEFDAEKFPDPRAMVEQLHEQGFKVTLWVPPFFDPEGTGFAEAKAKKFLVRHPGNDEPYLVRWWQGYGGLLDVSSRDALDWWLQQLQHLQHAYGIDGFKFDGGEGNFLPADAVTALPITRRQYADRYVQWIAAHFAWTEVRAGWRSQRHGLMFREWDKWSRWGLDNGLHSVLTQALTLSVIGYPFVLPDMIGGNAYSGERPDRELLIRWTQLTALLPSMQFSIPPWIYDDETDTICRRYAALHGEIAPYIQSLVQQALRDGTPLVRPLFWHTNNDQTALAVDDQFMLGDLLLVAPVMNPGQRNRNIYFPEGRWRDRWNGAIFDGPCWQEHYAAPLETLPLFERLRQD
jgi:alpha-glucosidase (family GH31 glycosyl hydrolase)